MADRFPDFYRLVLHIPGGNGGLTMGKKYVIEWTNAFGGTGIMPYEEYQEYERGMAEARAKFLNDQCAGQGITHKVVERKGRNGYERNLFTALFGRE